mmetsp:Transcript_35061/g.73998  ORF Transcript_35061/g.73998 Transcript_35061/m.73998 type:complete len:230 (-) Transcript_35061:868-1557(-)
MVFFPLPTNSQVTIKEVNPTRTHTTFSWARGNRGEHVIREVNHLLFPPRIPYQLRKCRKPLNLVLGQTVTIEEPVSIAKPLKLFPYRRLIQGPQLMMLGCWMFEHGTHIWINLIDIPLAIETLQHHSHSLHVLGPIGKVEVGFPPRQTKVFPCIIVRRQSIFSSSLDVLHNTRFHEQTHVIHKACIRGFGRFKGLTPKYCRNGLESPAIHFYDFLGVELHIPHEHRIMR